MRTVRVGKKSQIVIPIEFRERLGIKEGDELLVDEEDGKLILRLRPQSYTDFAAGLGADLWREIDTTEYVRKERDSWKSRNFNGN